MIEEICELLFKVIHADTSAKLCNYTIEEGKKETSVLAADLKDIVQANLFLVGHLIECLERQNERIIELSKESSETEIYKTNLKHNKEGQS